jgi:hypothetical protein
VTASLHVRLSLLLVAAFLGLGILVESMLGTRAAALMDDPLRREFVRLGHAHGGLLGLLNLGIGWAMAQLRTPEGWARKVRIAAWSGASCVGLGFLGGGVWHGATDPGVLVLLVPTGALLLLSALIAVALLREGDPDA